MLPSSCSTVEIKIFDQQQTPPMASHRPPHASCATVPRAVLCASFLRCCVLPVLLSDGVGGVGSDFGNEVRDPQLICAFLCRDVRVVMLAVTTYRWAMTSFRGT